MIGATLLSGTMVRFCSWGVAMTEPSAARMREVWASGSVVNSLGKLVEDVDAAAGESARGAHRGHHQAGGEQSEHERGREKRAEQADDAADRGSA